MRSKSQTIKKLRRPPYAKIFTLGFKFLPWIAVGFLLPKVFQSMVAPEAPAKQTSFEQAVQSLSNLESPPGGTSPPHLAIANQPQYGISQGVYDGWRYRQRVPPQDVGNISPEEVRAIYQEYWQEGDCGQYAAPLDMVCLDSMLGFGVEQGKRFLMDLPRDPQAAALEVTQKRQEFRQQLSDDYARVPSGQQFLRAGMERDRALAELVQSYSASQQSAFSFDLRRWLGFDHDSPTQQPSPSDPQRTATQPYAPTAPLTSDQIYAQAKPYTVEVWITTNAIQAPAAGIILSSDGLILTNYHVIKESSFDFVRDANGKDYDGSIIEVDPNLDLALIQLEGASNLPTARLATESSHIQVGETVYALGSPNGSHWKMTEAPVIQLQSDCGIVGLACIRTPQGFLNPGNSGGPLLDSTGQVVGINRAIQQRTGEGVSIPVETVQQFISRTVGIRQ